ncbi:MAG: M28 family peptidase [Alphaproteobacteria bacterium]|nr:M28 family peptidase [Alphaproteobacteria bacterium]MBU1516688.1 M28 family peptidase [Alphaproteobacteria bacterium]MBU2094444.1 M28 family peptidase [Alphaproteobacteria bacterium]MBU2152671.1 M28 family peptidase [Alphaproteobacteria bacterium]MBU2306163.1 M28 family peptidase [Alphaproteobacteria bacterium]
MKSLLTALSAIPAAMLVQASPAMAQPTDPDTRAWWAVTEQLSSDAMEGRDTGSAGYDRAAQVVADKFKAAGLKPAGVNGGWFQPVALREFAIAKATLKVGSRPLKFLYDVGVAASEAMPTNVDAPLAYRGYCGADVLGDVKGKLVVCHGARRAGLPSGADREAAVKAAGGIGILSIADPGFTVEPPRWPDAYAREVKPIAAKVDTDPFLRLRLNAEALAKVTGPARTDAADLIAKGSQGAPLPSFDIPGRFQATFTVARRQISSSNVLGLLPGSDPTKAGEAIVLSAHLDGYGQGTPVDGDGIYNGTLDDAAYVALLIRLAEQRQGQGYRRPIVFAAFMGEEKGLLGAYAFVANPTVPLARIAANINLDQLRPIFPLDLLTVHALDDTTLGDDVRTVTAGMGVAVQHDPEPERGLIRRADQWPFLQAGVPATAFVFGYRPGSESERIYRQWYRTGYHKPQDDIGQLMDWKAAADFNRFFYALVARVADADAAPAWKPGSTLKPKAP